MPEKDAMLKDVTNKAALAVIGAAVLSPGLRASARKKQSPGPPPRNARLHSMAGAAPERPRPGCSVRRPRSMAVRFRTHTGLALCPARRLVEQHKDSLNELRPSQICRRRSKAWEWAINRA